MPHIDFSPDSAPLAGMLAPSAKQMAEIQTASARIAWSPPPRCGQQTAAVAAFAMHAIVVIATTFVFFTVGRLSGSNKEALPLTTDDTGTLADAAQAATKAVQGTEAEAFAQALGNARTIHAVLAQPSQDDINTLFAAYMRGATVQLITEIPIEGRDRFAIFVRPAGSIKREGCLIDSMAWFDAPLPSAP